MKLKNQSGFTVIELLTGLFGVATVALAIFLIVVLVHFVSKYW